MKYLITTFIIIFTLPLSAQSVQDIKKDVRVGIETNSINVFYVNESFFNDLDNLFGTNAIKDTIRIEKKTVTLYASAAIDTYVFRLSALAGIGGKYGTKAFLPRLRGRIEGSIYPIVLFKGMKGRGFEPNRAFSLGYALEIDGAAKKKVVDKVQGYLFAQATLDFTEGEAYARYNFDLSISEHEKVKVPYFAIGMNYDLITIVDGIKNIF